MAKAKAGSAGRIETPKKKKPGIHSKKKASRHKKSKNYLKKYKGQGK